MAQATDTTGMRLTAGQKAWLAVHIAQRRNLPIVVGVELADTIAELLPLLPGDTTRRCRCGDPIGPTEFWCSRACFNIENDTDFDREEVEV